MSTHSLASVSIDNSMVEGIIRAQIETSLLAAMGNDQTKAMVLDGIVKSAMNDKVAENGKKSRYDHENRHEFLTIKTRELIQSVTDRVFKEWLEENEEHLAQLIRKSMEEQSHTIANGLVRSLVENSKSGYRTYVNVSVTPDQEDF